MVERASRAISLGLPKVPPLDEEDLASPANIRGDSFFDFFSYRCVRAAGKTSPLDVATRVFDPPMNC